MAPKIVTASYLVVTALEDVSTVFDALDRLDDDSDEVRWHTLSEVTEEARLSAKRTQEMLDVLLRLGAVGLTSRAGRRGFAYRVLADREEPTR